MASAPRHAAFRVTTRLHASGKSDATKIVDENYKATMKPAHFLGYIGQDADRLLQVLIYLPIFYFFLAAFTCTRPECPTELRLS